MKDRALYMMDWVSGRSTTKQEVCAPTNTNDTMLQPTAHLRGHRVSTCCSWAVTMHPVVHYLSGTTLSVIGSTPSKFLLSPTSRFVSRQIRSRDQQRSIATLSSTRIEDRSSL